MKMTSKERRVQKKYLELTAFLQKTKLAIGNNAKTKNKYDRDYDNYRLEKARARWRNRYGRTL